MQEMNWWGNEAAEISTTIQTSAIPGGQEHVIHQAIAIPAEEYGLIIEDEVCIYIPPTNPGSYPGYNKAKLEYGMIENQQ
jgi:hypothetical protein